MSVKIYTLSDPRSGHMRYVGKTCERLGRRLYRHLRDKATTHKTNWIKSVLRDGLVPVIELIEECCDEDWELCESFWIESFRFLGFKLTNIGMGGLGQSGAVMSQERREAVRVFMTGRIVSKETRLKISSSLKGLGIKPVNNSATREKISKSKMLSSAKDYETIRRSRVLHARQIYGEKSHLARLNSDQVIKIRSLSGVIPQWKIAKQFGISQSHAGRIIRGVKWAALK